jgi:uncharacterized Zn finger protein
VLNAARANGKTELETRALILLIKHSPSIDDYLRLESISGETWPQVLEELLAHITRPGVYANRGAIDILLHEGMMREALALCMQGAEHELIGDVVDSVLPHLPNEVIPICLKEAEYIINDGKAQYYDYAVRWLKRAKKAYCAAENEAAWREYFSRLVEKHGQKYKLMGLIKNI